MAKSQRSRRSQLEEAFERSAVYGSIMAVDDGGRRWRKMKGLGKIELPDGTICLAELHWYEAHGVGSKELKLKRIVKEL